jgi:hypothetical protein
MTLHVRPFIMWIEDVLNESRQWRSELKTPEWRKRLRLWYDTGESVSSAADMLRKWPWPKDDLIPIGKELRELRKRVGKK